MMYYYIKSKNGTDIIKRGIILSDIFCDLFKDKTKAGRSSPEKMGRIWNEANASGKCTRQMSFSISDITKT